MVEEGQFVLSCFVDLSLALHPKPPPSIPPSIHRYPSPVRRFPPPSLHPSPPSIGTLPPSIPSLHRYPFPSHTTILVLAPSMPPLHPRSSHHVLHLRIVPIPILLPHPYRICVSRSTPPIPKQSLPSTYTTYRQGMLLTSILPNSLAAKGPGTKPRRGRSGRTGIMTPRVKWTATLRE